MVKKLLFVFVAVIFCAQLFAQDAETVEISGTVIDKKSNEPIVGVTIAEKGTTNGTVTDIDGKFKLKVSSKEAIVVVSYIGYKTLERPVGETTTFDFTLEEESKNLEEVLITAVAIKREKRELGYSVQEVKASEVQNSQETNIVNALNSKVAGVQVLSSSGSPGASSRIRIRGNTSLTQNNDPLFVVDGIPIDNTGGEATRTLESSNRAIDINPNDIESMTVLKGPAATALYGIRAANGAIIITTKKGKSGKTTVNFGSTWGVDVVNKLPEVQTKYAGGNNGNFIYFDDRVNPNAPSTGSSRSWGPSYDQLRYDGIANKWDNRGEIVQNNDPNLQQVKPYDNLGNFFVPALRADNYLSVSGGGEKSTYFLSMGNFRQSGVVPNQNFERTSLKLTGSNQVNKIVKLTGSASYSYSTADRLRKGGNWGSPIVSLLRSPNDFDMTGGFKDPVNTPSAYQFSDGTQRQNAIFDNPYFAVNNNVTTEKINRLIGFVQTDITPLPWINFTGRIGTDLYHFDDRQTYSKYSAENHAEQSFIGSNRTAQTLKRDINSDMILSIDKEIGKNFNFGLRFGHNYWESTNTILEVTGYAYVFPNYNDLTNTTQRELYNRDTRRKLMALYSEAKIGYKNYAFLTGTVRREQASTLPAKNNTFTYPSLSASLVVTDMLNIENNNVLSYAKIRASAAQVGNLPNPFLTNTYFQPTNSQTFQGQPMYSSQTRQGNPEFKPEVSTTFEYGVEVRLFKNRASFDVTYYDTKNNNQIVPINVAASSGYSSAWRNSGFITNKGWEIVAGVTPIKSKFQWDMTGNFFTYQNLVYNVATDFQQIGASAGFTQGYSGFVNGQPYGVIISPSGRLKRYGQDPDDKTIRTDLPVVVDTNGLPIIEQGNFIVGNPNPKWTLGYRNTFSWKGFTLSTLLDIRQGGDVYNLTRLNMYAMGTHKDTEDRDVFAPLPNTVYADGTPNITPIYKNAAYYSNYGGDFGNAAERGIEDASWVRLRELTLGYNFPEKIYKVIKASALSLRFTGRNLFLYTKYSGVDPETNAAGNDPSFGRDAFNMPNTRSYTMSLNVTF